MAIIGSAYVEIRGIDKYLQRDIDNAMKKIKVPSLDFTSDVDLKPVRAKIKQLRNEIKSAPLQFKVDANYQEVVDNIEIIKSEQAKDPVVLNLDSNVHELEASLEVLKAKYSSIPTEVQADADTAAAEAQLGFAARNRRSTISMHISPATRKAFEGLAYTLIGAVPADKIRAGLQAIAGNFETLAYQATKFATIAGTVSASVLTLGANLFSVANDIGDVIGIAAVAPAALGMLGIGVTANILAWKDFGEAITGTGKKATEALAKLPKEAREAAASLKGVGTEIRKATQTAFWVQMGKSIQRLHENVIPQLKDGLAGAGAAMGRLTKAVLTGFWEMGANGTLEVLLANINKGFLNMERGVFPVVNALGRLGAVGSKYLPVFGTWLSDLGVQFDKFISKAARTGEIDRWINEAVNSFQNLGSIVKSTFSIFDSFGLAAFKSGAPGLDDFARGFRNIRDIVAGEPFQSKLVSILKDARAGTDAMADGMKALTDLVGKSTTALGAFVKTSGQITGKLLTNIKTMFDGTNLGTGLLSALWGLEDAMAILEPGFSDIGNVLGDLGEIAGEVFRSMAPGLNNLAETMSGVTSGLKDGVIAAMPIFNEFFQALLKIAQGPIIAIAEGFGNLLTVFSQLPGPMQTILISLGLIVAFRGKIVGLFSDIGAKFATMRAGIDGQVAGLSGSMQRMYGSFGKAGTNLSSVGTALRNIPFAVATSGFGGLATAMGGATKSLGKAAGNGLRGALSGGAAMLGGPWGIALGGAIALAGAFGQAQAESAERVKALSDSLDQQTAQVTNNTKRLIAENALDGATNGWDDFFRGMIQGSASTEETLSKLGISTEEYTKKISDPSGRDAYIKGLDAISNALRDGVPITDEMAAAIGSTKEELEGVNGNSMRHLADKARGAGDELTKAEEKVKALAAATGTSTTQAAILARNFDVLKSATSSASDKLSALKQNLDIFSNGTMSATTNQRNMAQSLADTKTKLADIAKEAGGSVKGLYSVKDGFNFASQAGRDLHQSLEGTADQILTIGTQALDQALKQGKSATDANSIAIQAMQPAIASLRAQLKDAGMLPPQIDAIVRSFGLMPDQITTAISVEGAEESQRKIFLTKLAADAFATGNYAAVLAALPDDAKKAIADATGTAKDFKNGNYDAILKALDRTGPGKEAALAQILSVSNGNYTAALKALNLTTPEVIKAKNSIITVTGKTVTIAANDGVSPTVYRIQQSLAGLRDKTINVTTYFSEKSIGEAGSGRQTSNAIGHIYNGAGTQVFANGGFSGFNVKNFASGSERHIAQIARGRWPVRMWAEPETGGEAYIPLALSKRIRSLEILEKVASMFGYSLFKKFADGGIMSGFATKNNSASTAIATSVSAGRPNSTSTAPDSFRNGNNPSAIIQVNPSPGMNEEAIGRAAARELNWQYLSK